MLFVLFKSINKTVKDCHFLKVSNFINQYGKKVDLKGVKQAIFCFNPSLAKKISEKYKPRKVFALGACLDIYEDFQKVLVSQFGFGAPASLLQLEYMKAFGIKEFFSIGTACALSSELEIAQGVFIEKAYGRTSYSSCDKGSFSCVENPHLEEGRKWAHFLNLSSVTSWTSDAPYKETELSKYLSRGVSCLEMEANAIMVEAHNESLKVFCFAFISDYLDKGQWHLSFSSSKLKEKSFLTLEKLLQQS